MIPIEEGAAFRGEQVKGRDPNIGQRGNLPAVPTVGSAVLLDCLLALLSAYAKCLQSRKAATLRTHHDIGECAQRRFPCRAGGSVLVAKQALRLCIPGQELGIQQEPVRGKLLPELGGRECRCRLRQ